MNIADSKKYFFITDDAEGAYAVQMVVGTGGIDELETYARYNGTLLIKSQYTNTVTGQVLGPYQQQIRRAGTNGAQECGPDDDVTIAYGMAYQGSTSNSGLTSLCKARLLTAHGATTLDESDATDWRKTITIFDPFYPVSMPVTVSAIKGDMFYKNSPNEYLWTGDYQADTTELTSRNKRFIGYA
jgi:hypothetical protein